MSARSQGADQGGIALKVRPVLLSTALGIAVCMLFLLLMSIVLSTQNIPHSAIEPMALFSLSAGSFAAGFSCGKIMRGGGLMFGAVCGGVLILLVLIAGMSLGDTGLGVPALFRIVFVLLSSMLGGVLGVNTKKRRK